jgi:hypothetical protein
VPGAKRTRKPRDPNAPLRQPPVVYASSGKMGLPAHVPGKRGRGARPEVYPFSTLSEPDASGPETIYDSFFVAAAPDMPNVARTLASVVTSANKRFKDKEISFKIFPIAVDVEFGIPGARVFRMT